MHLKRAIGMKGKPVFKLIMIIFVTTVMSCSKGKIIYAKYGKFKLAEGELNHFPLGKQEVQAYDNCCFLESDQIYLNRCIVNDEQQYVVFIAVSETLTPSGYSELLKTDSQIRITENKSMLLHKTKTDVYFIQKGQSYTTRFVYMENKGGLMVIYDYTGIDRESVKRIYDNSEKHLDEKIKL